MTVTTVTWEGFKAKFPSVVTDDDKGLFDLYYPDAIDENDPQFWRTQKRLDRAIELWLAHYLERIKQADLGVSGSLTSISSDGESFGFGGGGVTGINWNSTVWGQQYKRLQDAMYLGGYFI